MAAMQKDPAQNSPEPFSWVDSGFCMWDNVGLPHTKTGDLKMPAMQTVATPTTRKLSPAMANPMKFSSVIDSSFDECDDVTIYLTTARQSFNERMRDYNDR